MTAAARPSMSCRAELLLCCPVCQEVFREPVVLLCSHSFCRDCLDTWWSATPAQQCPVCKKTSVVSAPPSNLVLKNLCESFLEERERASAPLCSLHGEELKLFCLDHQEPVCLVCRDSHTHADHRFRPVEEAAEEHRQDLQESLEVLKERLEVLEEAKEEFHRTVEFIKVQADDTERQIKKQFQKLHRFLEEDEEARLSSLREEETRKRRLLEETLEALSGDVAALSETIAACEEELRAADHASFLRGCRAAVQRVRRCPLLEEPALPRHALLDQAQHLGNLAFHIWSSMKDAVRYTPLVLDPNTAHAELVLSEDLSSVTREERRSVPRNPERFAHHGVVVASRGLDSGAHSWVVAVEEDPSWDVGVLAESVERKAEMLGGFWQIGLSEGEYTASSPPRPDELLAVRTPLRRVAVLLDWDGGTLSFYDVDTETHVHTFHHTFTEKLFPFIYTQNTVRILAQDVSGTEESTE